MFKVNKTSSKSTKSKATIQQQVYQDETIATTITLKPIENSKLYRRRSLSRENIAKRNQQKTTIMHNSSRNNDVLLTQSDGKKVNLAAWNQQCLRNEQSGHCNQRPQIKNNVEIVDKTIGYLNVAHSSNEINTSSTVNAFGKSGLSGKKSVKIMQTSDQSNDVSEKFKIMEISGNMSLGTMICSRCDEGFEPHEKIVNSNGQLWHTQCFVCAQCFRNFQDGIFYEFEGRKYCERDFHVLFAPCCNKCGDFVIGRVIKAMSASWHPQCFRCEMCAKELADSGFIRNQNRALCHECNAKVKGAGLGKYVCNKCHGMIDDQPLRFRGEVYHGYHFNCTTCGTELDSTAREVKSRPGFAANDMNELYCLRCHDRMGIPICGACRRPIEERVVTALGKHWHVEHFVCAKCEKPFLGHRHYEKRGLAYCETHYHQLFGNLCFVCNQVIAGDVFTALNKAWCVHHFSCTICDQKMDQKSKFYEYDEKPTCKKCYDKFPNELRRRLRIAHEMTVKK